MQHGYSMQHYSGKRETGNEWLQIITKANTLGGHLGLKYF